MIKKLKTWAIFRLDSELPDGFTHVLGDALATEAFVPPASAVSLEARSGWVLPEDMLCTDFERRNDWLFNQYAFLVLRTDQKVLPPKLYAAEVKRRVNEWCQTNNRERAPSGIKSEISEQVKIEMAQRVLPKTTLIPLVWNIAEGVVFVGTHSAGSLDLVRKKFHRTFSRSLVPADAGVLDPEFSEEHFGDVDEVPLTFNTDFLRWLWYASETGTAAGAAWWVGDRIVFSKPAEEKTHVVVQGDDASRAQAAKVALRTGTVRGLQLCLRKNDREYTCNLDANLRVGGAKLPVLVKTGDVAEQFYERLFLMEELDAEIRHLVAEFTFLRSRPEAWAAHVAQVDAWAEGA